MANADFRLSFDVQTMDATVDASGVDQRTTMPLSLTLLMRSSCH